MKGRRLLKARWVGALLAVIIIVGCLLAAEPLENSAANVHSATLRSVAQTVTRPILAASTWLRLDEARRWASATFGAGGSGAATGQETASRGDGVIAPAGDSSTTAAPSATTATGPAGSAGPPPTTLAAGAGATSETTQPAVGTATPAYATTTGTVAASTGTTTASTSPAGTASGPPSTAPSTAASTAPSTVVSASPTAASSSPPASSGAAVTTGAKEHVGPAEPLRVLVAGDSLVLQVGHGVARLADRLPLETKVVSKPISGLARPDFYDWPVELAKMVAEFKPDVTVLMFGNNDAQDVTLDGLRVQRSTPEWTAMYRARVKAILAIPEAAGSRVIWVGMPIMRSAKFSQTALEFNAIYSEFCAAAGVPLIDCYALFANDKGEYAPYLPDIDGKSALMRASDGVHLSEAAGDLVAREIEKALDRSYDFAQD
jgi:uncharacterized protein